MNILKSIAVWACFIPLAILNGGLREHVLTGIMGDLRSLAASGVSLSGLILLATWLLLPRLVELTPKLCMAIGGAWTVLTVLFEFAFGLASGIPISQLVASYNPSTGNLWLLVLATTALSPAIVCFAKRKNSHSGRV